MDATTKESLDKLNETMKAIHLEVWMDRKKKDLSFPDVNEEYRLATIAAADAQRVVVEVDSGEKEHENVEFKLKLVRCMKHIVTALGDRWEPNAFVPVTQDELRIEYVVDGCSRATIRGIEGSYKRAHSWGCWTLQKIIGLLGDEALNLLSEQVQVAE